MLQSSRPSSLIARRWRRICLAILSALLLIIAAVQIIFLTDLPRNLAIAAVEKETGLHVAASSLSTGFFSHTTLNDVTIALPNSGNAFLAIPNLKLDHTWLAGLLIGDSLRVHVISVDHPHLEITENEQGKWNLQEAAQSLSHSGKPSKPGSGTDQLPTIQVSDASILITDNQQRSATLDHVNITGTPNGENSWQCRVDVPDHLDVNAQVSPGGTWTHEVDFDIQNIQNWIGPWVSQLPIPARLQGKWNGHVQSGHLVGKLSLDKTQLKTLSGEVTGDGSFDMENPYQSRLDLVWENISPEDLRSSVHFLAPVSGTVSGSLQIYPAATTRPLEPLAINLKIHSNGVRYSEYKIGDFQASGFFGPDRFVLEDTPENPTQFDFAGNVVHFWGRVTRHADGVYQSFIQLNLQNVQLDTILPAGSKIAKTPGLLSGQITIIGQPQHPERTVGQGTLTLDQSDLAGSGPVAFLYKLMHVGHNADKPTGTGTIDFTIQNKNIYLTAIRYFDKGTEVRLSGEIDDIPRLPHGPIDIMAVGSIKPLASIKLPGLSDFDAALETIQNSALAIHITGYLDEPNQKKIPFTDVGNEMKSLLFGDATTSQ